MSATASPSTPGRWGPEAALALLVGALGIGESVTTSSAQTTDDRVVLVVVALATAALVLVCRRCPGVALTGVWVLGAFQVRAHAPVMVVEVAVVAVSFATARWGRPLVLFLSGLSIPASAAFGVLLISRREFLPSLSLSRDSRFLEALRSLGDTYVIGAGVLGVALLGVPWLAGLAFRFGDTAKVSRASQVLAEDAAAQAVRESEQAREIAQLRDDQARLARDVHDVVGHSLAVILAQAESAQYLPEADTDKLKVTMQNIATSARSSLQDVRHVLAAGQDAAVPEQPRPLDTLLDGVRASGHEVVSTEVGTPQPLPPELEVVAYRVLQEMLTNALKHGRRDEPVFVERHWPDGSWAGELRVEVRNVVAGADVVEPLDETQPVSRVEGSADRVDVGGGQGLVGMRRRLDSVGGRLDVRRRDEADGTTFTTTAWVPVRTVSP